MPKAGDLDASASPLGRFGFADALLVSRTHYVRDYYMIKRVLGDFWN
jgi:hypothetical protein